MKTAGLLVFGAATASAALNNSTGLQSPPEFPLAGFTMKVTSRYSFFNTGASPSRGESVMEGTLEFRSPGDYTFNEDSCVFEGDMDSCPALRDNIPVVMGRPSFVPNRPEEATNLAWPDGDYNFPAVNSGAGEYKLDRVGLPTNMGRGVLTVTMDESGLPLAQESTASSPTFGAVHRYDFVPASSPPSPGACEQNCYFGSPAGWAGGQPAPIGEPANAGYCQESIGICQFPQAHTAGYPPLDDSFDCPTDCDFKAANGKCWENPGSEELPVGGKCFCKLPEVYQFC